MLILEALWLCYSINKSFCCDSCNGKLYAWLSPHLLAISSMEHRPVYMMDYVKQLDTILQSTGRPLLKGTGSISHEEAMDKAIAEYRKYQVKTLTPVEEAYLESINVLGKIAKRKRSQSGEIINVTS